MARPPTSTLYISAAPDTAAASDTAATSDSATAPDTAAAPDAAADPDIAACPGLPCVADAAFYAWGAFFIDRSGADGFKEKVAKDFVPTYIAEMCFWPALQTVNFTRVPVAHQLLAVNCLTLVDASFLSWARCQVGGC